MAKKKETENAFSVPRRAVWYVLRTLIIIIAVVTLTFFAFLTAMYSANIYIIVTEGMTIRAACVLGKSEVTEMEQYFTKSFIENDTIFKDNVYNHYKINNYDYRLTVDKLSVLPWNTTASVTVTERIPSINGTAYEDAPSASVPTWTNARYRVVCVRANNRWMITKLEVERLAPEEEPKATPDMSKTPIPAPTTSPTPAILQSDTTEEKNKP